jgi:DNA-binding Lrp family transcriptional regulator
MMRELLGRISRGESLDSISLELNVDRKEVLNRLDELVKRGYLKKVEMDRSCGSSKCANCPMVRSCSGDDIFPRIFELTPKGRRMLIDSGR